MTTREFIAAIADDTLFERDIIAFAESVSDKESLIWDLWLSDKVVWDKIGTPQITESKQADRVLDAILILSKKYDINIFSNKQEPQDPLETMHQVNTPADQEYSPKPFRERIIEAMTNKTGIFKYNNVSESVSSAIKKGIIEITDTGLKWKRSNVLLVYFFSRLICGDTIQEGANDNKMHWILGEYGNEAFPDKELEKLFGLTSLKQARNNRRGLTAPKGYKEIEDYIRI